MIEKSIYSKANGLLARRMKTSKEPDLSDFPLDEYWIFDTYEDELTKCVDGVVQELLETEINNLNSDKNLDEFRSDRNNLLAETDWTQVPDSPLSDVVRIQWQTYRQQLRDMPQADGFDPLNPTWPTSP